MLAGILVDVSASMSDALQLDASLENQPVTRAQSIFSTIISIVERDGGFRENEEIFVLAFGLQVKGIDTCDLLALLDDVKRLNDEYKTTGHARLSELMENNGAPYADTFIKKYLSQQAAGNLFETFCQQPTLLKDTIDKLPLVCKNLAAYTTYSSGAYSAGKAAGNAAYSAGNAAYSAGKAAGNAAYSGGQGVFSILKKYIGISFWNHTPVIAAPYNAADLDNEALKKSIEESLKSPTVSEDSEEGLAKKYIEESMQSSAAIKLKTILRPERRPVDKVVTLLRQVAASSSDSSTSEKKPLTANQLSHLVTAIKPYIYGDTPMCVALNYALETFQSTNHTSKVLFILSDGESKDGDPVKVAEQLHRSDVIVFACLLTSDNISHPRRLYDTLDPFWSKAQRDMFLMSSTVSNTSPVMAILSKKKWKLPPSGQSRLFLQANHPEVIAEFSSLVREIAESNDALLDMIGCVSLDLYINAAIANFKAEDQGKEPTCYAYAVATVFHLAMSRIGGRDGGVPEFSVMCEQLKQEFERKVAETEEVLEIWAPKYHLRYEKKKDELQARQAINARHTLVATFALPNRQWQAFKAFYRDNPKGTLRAENLPLPSSNAKKEGHAVVLMKCDPTSLTFMNSWGTQFANGGFFKVKDQSVLNLSFYDVYWKLEDLTETEKTAYQLKCRDLAQELADKLPSTVRNLPYECPQCSVSSPADQFTGHLLEATCPKCHKKFKPTALGLMRSLYTR